MSPEADNVHTTTPRSGLLFGFACYGIWGLMPLYFIVLDFASPLEIVANRTAWSLLFCAVLLPFMGGFGQIMRVLRQRRQVLYLAAAAALIAINWLVYVYAVINDQIVQASLGYFINPIVTVLLGVVVLRERLRRLQWLAVGISVVAVGIIAMGYGHLPWLAFALAASFGLYGLVKSYTGREIGALASLGVETLLLAPLALLVMLWLDRHGQGHFLRDGSGHTLLLMSSGIITALPLILFAAAARRLPLSILGLLQYLTPSMQFLIGVYLQHEAMSSSRWVGFALIWLALTIVSADAVRHNRQNRALRRANLEGAR